MGVRSATESLKIRQEILRKIKTQAQSYLGKEPEGLRRYALDYKKAIERQRWKVIEAEELNQALLRAEIIFGGDFHAFSQAQRVHLRHLRDLTSKHRIVLGLECVMSRYQSVLDGFIRGELSEGEFLKAVHWEKNWGFPWIHYKPLFDWIRSKGGRCVALNSRQPSTLLGLKKRDDHAAALIAKAYKQRQENEKLYVVFGDLHVAPSRLPRSTQKKIAQKVNSLILYLNPERVYFRLFQKNLENTANVLRFSKNEYCLLESPPWVKWQSYLLHLEESVDEALDGEDLDYATHLQSLFDILAMDLGISFEKDYSVFSFRDHDFLELWKNSLSPADYILAQECVKNDMNFLDPQTGKAYLARSTVSYTAQLAGALFHWQCCGLRSTPQSFPEDFERKIWLEAVAFFLSKLINPHRKAPTMNDLKKQLAAFSPQDKGEMALKLALDQKMKELVLSYENPSGLLATEPRKPMGLVTHLQAAQILGAMLGEKINQNFKTGRLSRGVLLQWMKQPIEASDFRKFYVQVLRELDKLVAGDVNGI